MKTKTKPFYRKIWFLIPCIIISLAVIVDVSAVVLTHGKSGVVEVEVLGEATDVEPVEQLTLLTINMAHGRGDGWHQIFQKNDIIAENVEVIGRLVSGQKAHAAALQEADAPSWWSGSYSHVKTVGNVSGMTAAAHAFNVDGLGLHYGTAVITKLKAISALQYTFSKNIPTFSKGFVRMTCEWPGDSNFKFDIFSIHLDFASSAVRAEQLNELKESIKESGNPVILMGDFNTGMTKKLLPAFVEDLNLNVWKKDSTDIVTFAFLSTRIDWIFASKEFRFVEQTILDDIVSDHRVVRAVVERSLKFDAYTDPE